jgi:hypothetical protein
MIKTIKEKPPEQVRERPFLRSGGLATFEPLNLKRSSRRRPGAGPAARRMAVK